VGGDEGLEAKGPERPAIVRHDGHHRQQLPGLRVDRAGLDQRVTEHLLVVGQGQLDRVDRVVLVPGGRDVEGVLVLGPVVLSILPAAKSRR
jgi:hypothetical protein